MFAPSYMLEAFLLSKVVVAPYTLVPFHPARPALAGSADRPRLPHEDSGGWEASGDLIMDFVILAVVVLVVALIVKGVRQKGEEEE